MPAKLVYTILLASSIFTVCLPAQANKKISFDSTDLHIRMTPRTPQQMAAFYEARGFSRAMLDRIQKYCFITVYIRNKSNKILWHNLENWHFSTEGKQIQRYDRIQLKHLWDTMKIPLAHQSTFRWTLLPEQLDFRPGEGEGGNIVLPRTEKAITIQAKFKTRQDKSGKPISIKLSNVFCKK